MLALPGCGEWPRDANGTLERVRGGAPLKVGYSVAAPWVRAESGPQGPVGVEPDLVRAWAQANGVRIDWVAGGESQLIAALSDNVVDVAVGGFTSATPHAAMIGTTQPYLTTPIVIGAVPGATAPDPWNGVEVGHDPRRPDIAAAIARAGAVPVPVAPRRTPTFYAAYEPELAARGLQPTGETLLTERRVIATAPTENTLVLSLDRFLHARKDAIAARVAQEARR